MKLISIRKGIKFGVNCLYSLCAIVLLCACASNHPIGAGPTKPDLHKSMNVPSEGRYKIGPYDVLRINVWKNEELSITAPVRPDGYIAMPLIGDVKVEGFVPEEVAKKITEKLSKHIIKPNVTVMITELHSHEYLYRIRVTGAVDEPASFQYRKGLTVLDAVLEAGGINEFAAPNSTKIYRKNSTGTEIIDVELGDILHKGRLKTNIMLMPGDIVSVPERLF